MNKIVKYGAAALTLAMTGNPTFAAQQVTVPTANPDSVASGGAAPGEPAPPALTDKEQAQLEKCKKMPSYQLEQSSKCTDLIKKVGGTIQQQDMNQTRQRLGQ